MTELKSEKSTETMKGEGLEGAPRGDSTYEKDVEPTSPNQDSDNTDAATVVDELDWDNAPENPVNWPASKKLIMLIMLSSTALLASIGTSIMSPARTALMQEFNVSSTVAILPLTFYVLALGLGPVIGGPLSETIGRYPIYVASVPLGGLFTLGCGLVHSIGGLTFLRFMAGLCWGPVLAVATGSISETFAGPSRGPASAIFILMPFLGPGLGPVIGSFVVTQKNWRWTQWTLLFFAAFTIITTVFSEETYHPIIKRRLAKKRGLAVAPSPPLSQQFKEFANVAVLRPLNMMFFEPITAFFCLYIAVEFGTLFSFFAAVPYTFYTVYRFNLEHSGLVFLAIVIGCFLGLVTITLCDVLLYRKQIAKRGASRVPPEYRLYPAMIGSVGPPIGLFWFGWSARDDISWASPAAAIMIFAWGNLSIFVSAVQYMTDAYHGSIVASGASANSLARYGFAAVFPLFTLQMYEKLGIDWASSLLGFISLALLPIPWVLFKFGPEVRARSKYETVKFEEDNI